MKDYTKYNAREVLENVEVLIGFGKSYDMKDVYEMLSIFDWWVDKLSQTKLKDMRKFLKEAIKLGYRGYVCFKVGAEGCANGMWAYKVPTTDGFSPEGDFIYKSFTPSYNYWDILYDVGEARHKKLSETVGKEYDGLKTIRDLENAIYEKACNTEKEELTYKEFIELAEANYYNGGDQYVECWDEKIFDSYVDMFGPVTREKARNMFKLNHEINEEQKKANKWAAGEDYREVGYCE